MHDSSIDEFQFTEDGIVMKFDWAKVVNSYKRDRDTLIIGNCRLELYGIKRNYLEAETKEDRGLIDFPDNFPQGFGSISQNSSRNDNQLTISGLLDVDDDLKWINWIIEFDNFQFSWDNYVTSEDWKNGKLPEAKDER